HNLGDSLVKGPLGQFRQHSLVRFVVQGGAETTVIPRGIRDWEYSSGGYKISEEFEVTTPSGTFLTIVIVHGKESQHKEFTGRQWSVLWQEMRVLVAEPTPLGET